MKQIKVYLAGRIGGITVDQKHCMSERRFGLFQWTSEKLTDKVATTDENSYGDDDELSAFKYVGPFIFAGMGGHCDGRSNGFGSFSHGSDDDQYDFGDTEPEELADDWRYQNAIATTKFNTLNRALDGIRLCDAFFAWVDDFECYGTIAEIGYARALGKPIYIGCTRKFKTKADELWFPFGMANKILVADHPEAAARSFLIHCAGAR